MNLDSVLEIILNRISFEPIFRFSLLNVIHIELLVLLFAIILLLFLSLKEIKKQFIQIKKVTWVLLFLIFLVSLLFRFTGPHYHFIFYDENYINTIARNILIYNVAGQCTYTSFISDKLHCNVIQPFTGWGVVTFISYFLLGAKESVSLYLTSFIGALTVILVFVLAYLLFERESPSLIAAFLFSICFTHITWSRSSISNIISLFLILLLFIIQLIYCRTGTLKLNLLIVLIFTFSIQTRIENLMYLPIIFITYFLFFKEPRKIKTFSFIIPSLLLLFLIIFYVPQVRIMLISFLNKMDLHHGEQLALFSKNIVYFLTSFNQPRFLYLFLIIGLLYSFFKYKKQMIFLILLYSVTLLIYSNIYQMHLRYYLLNLTCIIYIQSIGIIYTFKIITNFIKIYKKIFSFILIFLILLIIFIPSYKMIKEGALIRDYQVMTLKIPSYATSHLDKNCYIIANALDEVTFSSGTLFKTMLVSDFTQYIKYNKWAFNSSLCFLFYEGMSCKSSVHGPLEEVTPREECKLMHDSFNLKPQFTYKAGASKYNLYKIEKDKSI